MTAFLLEVSPNWMGLPRGHSSDVVVGHLKAKSSRCQVWGRTWAMSQNCGAACKAGPTESQRMWQPSNPASSEGVEKPPI